jgi:hypothetical protein
MHIWADSKQGCICTAIISLLQLLDSWTRIKIFGISGKLAASFEGLCIVSFDRSADRCWPTAMKNLDKDIFTVA